MLMATTNIARSITDSDPVWVRAVRWFYAMMYHRKEREISERMIADPQPIMRMLFFNPMVTAQAGDEQVFAPDYWMGHTLPRGREFLGEHGFVSFEQAVDSIRSSRGRVVLNVGDSSTSGWNSD